MKRSKAFYAATIFAMVALTAGFVLGAITLGTSTQNGQGNLVTASGAVQGLTYTSTVLGATPTAVPPASTGTAAAPQALVAGANPFCANACVAGDFAETVTFSFTSTAPAFAGSAMITITVSTGAPATGGTTTLFLKQAAVAVTGTIVVTWDLGAGGGTINSVTLTAQQCTGATCP